MARPMTHEHDELVAKMRGWPTGTGNNSGEYASNWPPAHSIGAQLSADDFADFTPEPFFNTLGKMFFKGMAFGAGFALTVMFFNRMAGV